MNFAPGGNKLSGFCGCVANNQRSVNFEFVSKVADPFEGSTLEIKKPGTVLQWIRLYRLYQSAFPANEKKPFSMIYSMQKKKKTDIWYCEEDGKFVGLVITINGSDKILLDYLAVAKNCRGQGIGSKMLKQMRKQYGDKGLFLEIEVVTKKANNYEERKRRKKFYLSNGMTEMHTFVELFGVDMELLGFDCNLTFEEYHEFYRDNYSEWAAEHVKKGRKEV